MEPICDYDVIVIGSGFGGTMTSLTLARAFKVWNENHSEKKKKILLLERGTWWTTPVSTVQDKGVKTYDFLNAKGQPVQFWPSVEHLKGFVDIFLRCVRRKNNEDGLYDPTYFKKTGFLGIGAENDGVSILRASGVGGGSLVYSNITLQPPDLIFEDERWKALNEKWDKNKYYEIARNAIGVSVLYALNKWEKEHGKPDIDLTFIPKVNRGLSNIATRSARLNPHWNTVTDPSNGRQVKQIQINDSLPPNDIPPQKQNRFWIDRARVFQTAMYNLRKVDNGIVFGNVDSAINDLAPEPLPTDPQPANPPNYEPGMGDDKLFNYCERQGRCNVGCLPGARHTLNKQLMRYILGDPANPNKPPEFPDVDILPLAEIEIITSLPDGGYRITYLKRDHEKPSKFIKKQVTAKRVIISAGCVGTNEIMLRSKKEHGLKDLTMKTGEGFSTNGDYIAFLDGTKEKVNLNRGPVTTSFGHFHADKNRKATFHTIEDQGIPRSLSSLAGFGIRLLQQLSSGNDRRSRLWVWIIIIFAAIKRLIHVIAAFFKDAEVRQDVFTSEDEMTDNMMCVVAAGREDSLGKFRLGNSSDETILRLHRTDGKPFHKDDIYKKIEDTLKTLAPQFSDNSSAKFRNPFYDIDDTLGNKKTVTISHPLGGCIIAADAAHGTVDYKGRVFKNDNTVYEGLYIADASVIPTALGVNPSLTISAISLWIADEIINEMRGTHELDDK
jgi:choline dehydrogenase-like flavoprotein